MYFFIIANKKVHIPMLTEGAWVGGSVPGRGVALYLEGGGGYLDLEGWVGWFCTWRGWSCTWRGRGDTCTGLEGAGDTCTWRGRGDTCTGLEGAGDTCTWRGRGDTCTGLEGASGDTCTSLEGAGGDTCTWKGLGDTVQM